MGEPSLESLRPALAGLEELFGDIWLTQDMPDYAGPRWLEFYRGSPMDETFTCVDFCCNVLHVVREGRRRLTVIYVPGWFYEVATDALSFGLREVPMAFVTDLAAARPLRFELEVEHELAEATRVVELFEYSRLSFGYEFEPGQAAAVEPTAPEAMGSAVTMPSSAPAPDAEQVQWSAMKLRLVAAPGVRVTRTPLVSEEVLVDARRVYVPKFGAFASCVQAVQVELERRQDPHALPGLGVRARRAPLAEADLVAGSVTSQKGCALALEQTRPDGVDILLARPGPGTALAPWLLDLPFELLRGVVETLLAWQGGIPPEAPLPIRIRVDPTSAEDRFAYRIQYLDTSGQAVPEPTEDVDDEHPCIRLSVKRTAGVRVQLDTALASWGADQLGRVVEYREEVAHFDDVPLFLHDDNDVYGEPRPLDQKPATLWDILTVAMTLGEFVPLPAVEVLYDLRDLAGLATYALYGRDVMGEEMTALDAALTLGGFLVPEVGERAVKGLARAARRLRTIGDDPFARLVAAGEALTSADEQLLRELAGRAAVPAQ